MSGSKKGERRGGAKPGHIRKSAAPAKRKAGRPPGSKNRPKVTIEPGIVRILNKRIPVERKERDLEMYFTVTGRRVRLPKEVMLDAMRYFEEGAIEYSEVLRANMEAAAKETSPQAQAILSAAIAAAEGQVDKYVSMAVDVAYKAAPYIHPRLAAFISRQGDDKSPTNLLQLLMQDLDEAGQPARYIDHDVSEVVK